MYPGIYGRCGGLLQCSSLLLNRVAMHSPIQNRSLLRTLAALVILILATAACMDATILDKQAHATERKSLYPLLLHARE